MVLRRDQGRRHGRGAGPAAVLAALSVLSLGLRRSVRPAPDRDRRAGRADRQVHQARRPELRRAHHGRLRLRESARAAARDDGRRLEGRGFRQADRRRLAGRRRSGEDRAAGEAAAGAAAAERRGGRHRAARALHQHRGRRRGRARRPARCWCSTTCGIRGGARPIDGNETEIFRANAIFRAVQVPPGKFTVRFTFEPLRGAWNELRAKHLPFESRLGRIRQASLHLRRASGPVSACTILYSGSCYLQDSASMPALQQSTILNCCGRAALEPSAP